MSRDIRSIAVYCGANPRVPALYMQAAYQFGCMLARRGIRLVYGGGTHGMMGAVAQGTLDGNGPVLGIIPKFLIGKETTATPMGDQIVVADMHERKRTMLAQADAIVALPGGLGTLDELMEALAWVQLGLIRMPTGLLNTADYFAGLLQWLDQAVQEKFLRPQSRAQVLVDTDGERLLERMALATIPDPIV